LHSSKCKGGKPETSFADAAPSKKRCDCRRVAHAVPWEPVIVLFTSTAAANEHLLTDTQIAAAATSGDAVEIANPAATFHCAKVSNRIWDLGTPVTPFTG